MSDKSRTFKQRVLDVLADPTVFPQELKNWLPRYTEQSVTIAASQVTGLQSPRVSITDFASLKPGQTEMEVLLAADSTNGVYWHLRYHPASASSYKWEFLGGPPMYAYVEAQQTTTSLTYVDLATAGPSITTPRAGDYIIDFAAEMAVADSSSAQPFGYTAVKLGGAATSDLNALVLQSLGNAAAKNQYAVNSNRLKKTLATSDVIKLQYRAGTATSTLQAGKRALSLTPIRIS